MSRKNKPLPIFENVTITGIAAEGRAVARVGDMVVFAVTPQKNTATNLSSDSRTNVGLQRKK